MINWKKKNPQDCRFEFDQMVKTGIYYHNGQIGPCSVSLQTDDGGLLNDALERRKTNYRLSDVMLRTWFKHVRKRCHDNHTYVTSSWITIHVKCNEIKNITWRMLIMHLLHMYKNMYIFLQTKLWNICIAVNTKNTLSVSVYTCRISLNCYFH